MSATKTPATPELHDGQLGLADVEGVLCITDVSSVHDRPVFIRVYWPTTCRTVDWLRVYSLTADKLAEARVIRNCGASGGEFTVYPEYKRRSDGTEFWGYGVPLCLVEYGRTRPIKVDKDIEYPPPKTRCQTRYLSGRWQVLRGRSGWKDA